MLKNNFITFLKYNFRWLISAGVYFEHKLA